MEALYGSLPGFGSAAKNDVDAPIAFFDCIYVGTPGGLSEEPKLGDGFKRRQRGSPARRRS